MNIKELLEAKYDGPLSRTSIMNAYKTIWKNLIDKRDRDVIIDNTINPSISRDRCRINLFVTGAKDQDGVRRKVKNWADQNNLPFTKIIHPEWYESDENFRFGELGEYGDQWVTSIMYRFTDAQQRVTEAGLATGPPSWISAIPKRHWTVGGLDKFVKPNKKLLDDVFEVMKYSFIFFYEMSIEYMDEQPHEYSEKNRDPQDIAHAWYEGWSNDFSIDESPALLAAVKHLDGPDFQDVLQYMNDFVLANAKHIVDNI